MALLTLISTFLSSLFWLLIPHITHIKHARYGTFPFPEWHKREREDILNQVGVKVEYGEQIEEGVLRGTFKTVGDKEHTEIVRLYVEENLGMAAIASKFSRSSRTILNHIRNHNKAINRSGFCATCKRVDGTYQNKRAERTRT